MSETDNASVVHAYFRCLNTEAWDKLAGLWHEDGELRAVGARPRQGRDEVLAFFHRLFDPWRAHLDEPTRVVVAGDVVVAEVRFTGTTHQGREVGFDAVDVIDLRDGRVCRLTNWYDLDYVRRELATPAPEGEGRHQE
jgi:ketosteroid isomerase-like protein